MESIEIPSPDPFWCDNPYLDPSLVVNFEFNLTYSISADELDDCNGCYCNLIDYLRSMDVYPYSDFNISLISSSQSNTTLSIQFLTNQDLDNQQKINIQNLIMSPQNADQLKMDSKSPIEIEMELIEDSPPLWCEVPYVDSNLLLEYWLEFIMILV